MTAAGRGIHSRPWKNAPATRKRANPRRLTKESEGQSRVRLHATHALIDPAEALDDRVDLQRAASALEEPAQRAEGDRFLAFGQIKPGGVEDDRSAGDALLAADGAQDRNAVHPRHHV